MEKLEAITNDPKQRLNTEQFAALFQSVSVIEKQVSAPVFPGAQEVATDLPKESRVTGLRQLGLSRDNDFGQNRDNLSAFSTLA